MSARRRRSPLVVAGLVLAGLVGAAPVGAATTGPATTGPAAASPGEWTGPSLDVLRSGPAGRDVRAAGLLDASPAARPTAAGRRQSTVTAGYADTCHDAESSPLDLREIAFSADTEADEFVLTVTSCSPWDGADLGPDGSIDIPLAVPGGRTDGPDYAIFITAGADSGLRLSVVRTPTDDPATWEDTASTAMVRPDAHTGEGAFPQSALGDPGEFVFVAGSVDAEQREDVLPEDYADALEYPFSCSLQVQQAATVVVHPAQAGRLTGLARAHGAAVRAAAPAVLSLEKVTDATLHALRRAPGVRSAERAVVYRRAAVPDDPAYPRQWYLPALGAPDAWDVRTGSRLVLAVVDDGVDGLRSDLAEKVLPGGRDTVYDVPLAIDSDLGGHGTAVAGLAAAQTDNSVDVSGLDWDADVLPYRVFDAAGCATDGAVTAALYAARDAGASVANLSLGGPGSSEALRQAVQDVTADGMLVVAASGNARGVDDAPNYPAAYPEVLAVGATTRSGELASYSSGGDHVDITAPGGEGSGTADRDLLVLAERGTLAPQAGTSFAAPLVSAAALLFRAGNPDHSPGQVIEAIERSAVDAGPPGRDPDYGAGRLDVRALLGSPTVSSRGTALACPPGQVPEDGFADVPQESVHEGNVDCVVWWQVSTGSDAGYDPLSSVTRAQMATFLARLIERSAGVLPADPPDAFLDDEDSVHELRINQLANLGIVSGRGAGTFAPGEPVTRGQMATFLVRGYEFRSGKALPPAADYFADDDGTTHEPRINQAADAGFTGGLASGGYGPTREVRRDGMATFLARVLDRLVADGRTTPPGA